MSQTNKSGRHLKPISVASRARSANICQREYNNASPLVTHTTAWLIMLRSIHKRIAIFCYLFLLLVGIHYIHFDNSHLEIYSMLNKKHDSPDYCIIKRSYKANKCSDLGCCSSIHVQNQRSGCVVADQNSDHACLCNSSTALLHITQELPVAASKWQYNNSY